MEWELTWGCEQWIVLFGGFLDGLGGWEGMRTARLWTNPRDRGFCTMTDRERQSVRYSSASTLKTIRWVLGYMFAILPQTSR